MPLFRCGGGNNLEDYVFLKRDDDANPPQTVSFAIKGKVLLFITEQSFSYALGSAVLRDGTTIQLDNTTGTIIQSNSGSGGRAYVSTWLNNKQYKNIDIESVSVYFGGYYTAQVIYKPTY